MSIFHFTIGSSLVSHFIHCLGNSLVQGMGTSHWLLRPIGNSHWLLNWISLDWHHHHKINGRTETLTVSHWIGHLLASIIGHWLKLILSLVHDVNYNVSINTCTCCFCKLVLRINCMILVPLINCLRHQHFGPSNQILLSL